MSGKLLHDNWYEIRDQLGEWWEDLTDEDLNRVDGDREQLIHILQERYSYTRNLAVLEVEKYLAIYCNPENGSSTDHNQYEEDLSSASSINWNENEFSRGISKYKGNRDSLQESFRSLKRHPHKANHSARVSAY